MPGPTADAETKGSTEVVRQRPHWSWAGRTAFLIGTCGISLRGVLMAVGVPPTNSDEGMMGLAALHIANGSDYPIWFYGQHYMGVLEAYLAAPLVSLFGTHTVVLRVPELLFFACFLLLAYRLTRMLYTPWLAVITIALLSLGSDRVIKNEMIAGGGYPEILPMATLLILLSISLAGTAADDGGTGAWWRNRRRWAFAGWGVVAGVCLWSDWLVIPYLAAATAVLAWGCHREIRGLAGAWLVAGASLGAAPLIIYNLSAGPGMDSLSVYSRISASDGGSLGSHFFGSTLLGIPLATGLCAPSHCAPAVRGWGVAYLVLLVVAVVLALRAYRRGIGQVRVRTRELGRLALLAGAAVTYLAYLHGSGSASTPIESARYEHLLLISTPAILWPLWTMVGADRRRYGLGAVRRYLAPSAAWIAVVALLASGTAATVTLVERVPPYHRFAQRQQNLVATLDRIGATRVYSDYWTCGRIVFATGERIICAALNDDLSPGLDRYAPYRAVLTSAAKPVWVFPAGSPIDDEFASSSATVAAGLTVLDIDEYHLYLPASFDHA